MKERSEQPNHKRNPPMITSAKKYTKKKERKKDRQNFRINGKSKAIQIKAHKEAYTYTQKEKKEKYIYIVAPKTHRFNLGMICCLFRYSTDAGYIKLILET